MADNGAALTDEQQAVVDAFCKRRENVAVDAMPGTGKTMVALHCLATGPWTRPLYLTYNRSACDAAAARLAVFRDNTHTQRQPCAGADGNESSVHTFHGAARWLFGRTCRDDQQLEQLMDELGGAHTNPSNGAVDALIVDEAQDLRLNYARFVQLVMDTHCAPGCPVLLVGNRPQTVHAYHPAYPASPLFLEHPDTIFTVPGPQNHAPLTPTAVVETTVPGPQNKSGGADEGSESGARGAKLRSTASANQASATPWRHLKITRSFRLSGPAAEAITLLAAACGVKNMHVVSEKHSRCGARPYRFVVDGVPEFIRRDSMRQGSTVAVLFNTLDCHAARTLAAACARLHLRTTLCYSGAHLAQARAQEERPGAVAFLTFCMAKGLEWDHVYVCAAHNTLWERHGITELLPNTLFVALTRARDRTTVFWDGKSETPPRFAALFPEHRSWRYPGPSILANAPDAAAWDQFVANGGAKRKRRRPVHATTPAALCTRLDVGCLPPAAMTMAVVRLPVSTLVGQPCAVVDPDMAREHTDAAMATLAALWCRTHDHSEDAVRRVAFRSGGAMAASWWRRAWAGVQALYKLAPLPQPTGKAKKQKRPPPIEFLLHASPRVTRAIKTPGVMAGALVLHLLAFSGPTAEAARHILASTHARPHHVCHVVNIRHGLGTLLHHVKTDRFRMEGLRLDLPGTRAKLSVVCFTFGKNSLAIAWPAIDGPSARECCYALLVVRQQRAAQQAAGRAADRAADRAAKHDPKQPKLTFDPCHREASHPVDLAPRGASSPVAPPRMYAICASTGSIWVLPDHFGTAEQDDWAGAITEAAGLSDSAGAKPKVWSAQEIAVVMARWRERVPSNG